MKVVCLDNTKGNTRYLESNKVYDTKELPGDRSHLLIGEYYIIDLNRHDIKSIWVRRKDMITLDQWRQLQLDKLDIAIPVKDFRNIKH